MKILFISNLASIHTARWVSQLQGMGWDVHCFHAIVNLAKIRSQLAFSTIYAPYPVLNSNQPDWNVQNTLPIYPRLISLSQYFYHKFFFQDDLQNKHIEFLAQLIKDLKPDVIHSLGLNVNWVNLCKPVLQARMLLGNAFGSSWIYSSWGADLDHYAQTSKEHHSEVEKVLRACNYYIAECRRDLRLAREMGFSGEFLGFLPAFGGIDWELCKKLRQREKASARKIILLKGRDQGSGDPQGRALIAIQALEGCADLLSGYEIYVAQAGKNIIKAAETLRNDKGLNIKILPFSSYSDWLEIVARSRVVICLTVSDGLPGTLVETMALGACVLHSDLEPIREWITDGQNGLLVPPEDLDTIIPALRRALTDDNFVERASELNAVIVENKLSDSFIRPKIIELYQQVAESNKAHRAVT